MPTKGAFLAYETTLDNISKTVNAIGFRDNAGMFSKLFTIETDFI